MKKLNVLALVAVLLVTGSAFAAGRLTQAPNATSTPGAITSGGIAAGAGPATTNNDDSCDIGVAPAATLLLPYFEVDLGTAGTGRTTLFSITNVSPYSQIAHVVLYTDWSFPVLDFNIFLTGYDVQPINLYDVIGRGLIASTSGTSYTAPNARDTSLPGPINNVMSGSGLGNSGINPNTGTQPFRANTSADNFGNPNFLNTVADRCAPGRLPGQLPTNLANDVKALLTVGTSTGSAITCPDIFGRQVQVGGNHGANTAIGYATIDVAATCSTSLPVDRTYFTGEILFDNVLIGEYYDVQQSTTTGNYAGGNPMVHIRAIPEGGTPGQTIATNLPFTFYDRYTGGLASRTQDRRQPLPSAFAARWISGTGALFDTQFKIWREGLTSAGAFCEEYVANSGDFNSVTEFVRFDERENAGVIGSGIIVSPPPPGAPGLPEASRTAVTASLFPALTTTDAGGWMYMNLNNGGDATAGRLFTAGIVTDPRPFNATRPGFGASFVSPRAGVFPRDVSQNWVIVSMFAAGVYGVDYDAAWLGNGCSAALPGSSSGASGFATNRVAPAGGVIVCPTNTTITGGTALVFPNQCTGTNVTP